MGKKVLITGASGFVGANLTRRLLDDGHQVCLLLRPNYNPWRLQEIEHEVSIYKLDLLNAAAINKVVSIIQPEWIFHLAVYGAYSVQSDIDQIINTNIVGTKNLLTACMREGFSAFINTGSSSEYGFKQQASLETDLLEPNSYYGVAKASASMLCRYIAQSQQLNIPTLRLFSVYGPYEDPQRLLPKIISYGLRHQLPDLVSPDIARDFIYVDDVVDAYLLAAKKKHQEAGAIYNVGSGVQTTVGEVVKLAQQEFLIKQQPQWGSMSNRIWDTNIWVADNNKIKNDLGWRPKFDFQAGFKEMSKWFASSKFSQGIYY